jgi:hypothetical protein
MKIYEVKAHWDGEGRLWRAESEDVPGLVAEAATVELLLRDLRDLVPELLSMKVDPYHACGPIPFRLIADRAEWASRHLT